MLFNSGTFFQFFAAFLLLYYAVRNHLPARNILIVAASYLFYGWWDYRFLSLLIISSLLDFTVGLALEKTQVQRQRQWLLGASIAANLGILGFFKYYGFFVESLTVALEQTGIPFHPRTLHIVLPVGISFYTFQTMSYAIDVYRGEMKAARNLVQFLAYVSFFPQLVAGPIERASHLLPQFGETRRITRGMVEEGLWLCLWGMFKKVVIADNLAPLVEMAYEHPAPGGVLIALATLAFGFQIYCDFSGYSDMARGMALFLGFHLMLNFRIPYAAANVQDFWRRWHISLSTWLRDYLYISLGGNRRGRLRAYANLFLTMLLGGLWHGAAWNFLAWGAWHGAGLMAHRFWRERPGTAGVPRLWGWLATMAFVFYGWLLFRAGSWERVAALSSGLLQGGWPGWLGSYVINLALFLLPLAAMEYWQHRSGDLLAPLRLPRWPRAALQGALILGILIFWEQEKSAFIYFQF